MHDSWAREYDFVYDQCFGEAFWRLTAETLAVIGEAHPAPARVLEVGAGTGRIAVPLALLGYDVTAVEISAGMADMLERRAARHGARLRLVRADLRTLDADTDSDTRDLMLAIFTVFNYLVSDDDLDAVVGLAARRLRSGGRMVFDLAARRLFASAFFESDQFHREIDVRPIGADLFRYHDTGVGVFEGQRFAYDEVFTFRYWRDTDVLARFERAGFKLVREVTDRLRESGSRWFVIERA